MNEKEKVNTGVVDVDSPESVFSELRGEIARITILRNGSVLDRVYPEQVDDDIVFWVKEKYGGGKYNLILFGKDGKVKKRLSFVIDGSPKYPDGEEKREEGALQLVEKLIEKLEEKRSSSPELATVFQMMMQMQQQQFQLLLQTLKQEKRESSFLEKFIDKVLSNPAVLMSAGGGLWKLLQKAVANKNELLELLKVAKDDPEIKQLAVEVIGAKYGAGGGIVERILGNPELLNKALEIINKGLEARALGQNPGKVIKRELQSLKGSKKVVNNPQSTLTPSVDNQEVVAVQEIIAVGTKILDLAERGESAEDILNSLSDREVELLAVVSEQYGIENHEGLIELLESLPVPRFTVAGYIEAIRRHKDVIDELLSYLFEEGEQEEEQANIQVVEEQVKRETTGNLQGESQGDLRRVTGEG